MKKKTEHPDGHTATVSHSINDLVHGSHQHNFKLHDTISLIRPDIIALLTNAVETTASPWAIILVRFSDQIHPLPPLTAYQNLFTSTGNSRLNMVDFFKDMSHGKLDLNGSRVFGWYTLPARKKDYVGNTYPQPAGKLNRDGLVNAAKAVATANGVDLSKFAGIVVSAFEAVDLCGWVGGMTALCDSLSLTPSLLGQEMGHGYGLDHARHNGSTDDYTDPWDVMSTAAFPLMQATNSDWGTVGPGLNAWNMRSRGWLDETRVWKSSAHSFTETVQLRPLHHHNRRGWLALEIDRFLIEFRVQEKWDAAIPRACVLVHSFRDNHSYLMPSVTGSDDLGVGDRFESGDPNLIFIPYVSVTVNSIDPATHTATVTVVKRAAVKLPNFEVAVDLLGGIPIDGGGIIIVGSKVIKVPPHNPINEILRQVARYLDVQYYNTGVNRALAEKQDAVLSMILASANLLNDLEFVSDNPPGYNPTGKIFDNQ